tara:strand:- start:487 stop:780 length:294 start_codon:yes stop_codon:yes gene_type:complete
MKLIYSLTILLFLITHALAEDRESFSKKVKKNPYVKETEWIDKKTFLVIVDQRVTAEDYDNALRDVCKLAKKKFSINGFESQIAYKRNKILKKKNCK